jgi:hypothetical protein
MRPRLTLFISGILVSLLAAGAFAAELGAQRSSAGGVIVAVTPQNLAASAKSWDFKVVLDTHSGELKDDLAKSAVLVVDGGGSYTPTAWQGDPPGGHHREGTLKFNAISPRPKAIELRIQRPGESKPRSFRWQLK